MVRKLSAQRMSAFASLLALSIGLIACSSDSDDTSPPVSNDAVVDLTLDSASTVPPATGADAASGTGSFTINRDTGAVSGSVTVSGTTGPVTAAHIHEGAVGETGSVVIGLEANDDATVWSAPENAALDTAQLETFEAGNLYVNVHTAANMSGELRAQLDPPPLPGSYTITFTNTSDSQLMTPPVVALHTPPGAENGVSLFTVGEQAIQEIVEIAENGFNTPLVTLATQLVSRGSVSDAGVAAPEVAGPLNPGDSSTITLMPSGDDQVLSLVSMVVCTNDGFSGVNSRPLASETFTASIYDAGSEINTLELAYWVPPCSMGEFTSNLHADEGGVIALHPGQEGTEAPEFNFPAGTELLEVTVTAN